ncbi:MAG: NRDE family protein [Myxococcales bacterium]|nr:NRDE family protein [Myxococcales bacterium]
MCTLVIAARTVPGCPLVVVANRDEQRARASSPAGSGSPASCSRRGTTSPEGPGSA